MVARIAEWATFGHLWGSEGIRAVFEEEAVLQRWLDVLAALARAQADVGLVPVDAAEEITRRARIEYLDLQRVAEQTRSSGHSTLGLIRELGTVLSPRAHSWVYYGATVQDVTDTSTALAFKQVGTQLFTALRAIEDDLLQLAQRHRDTPMAGRTHGQAGAPITFGFKAASWADELRRHVHRFREGAPRWLTGQLGGAVGTLAFFGEQGLAVRARFCQKLDLADPGMSWLVARDRVVEFTGLLELLTGTLARIGNEVYQLQRTELGELREPVSGEGVSSITMPHKRNPEVAEHLVTLHRLTRASNQVVREGLVGEHERDGRSWKAEWVAVPEVCLLTGAATSMARELTSGLEVDPAAMEAGLEAMGEYAVSERLLALLSPRLGKHRAQDLLQRSLAHGRSSGRTVAEVVRDDPELSPHLDERVLEELDREPATGAAPAMVDRILDRARSERASEGSVWP